MNLRHGVAGAWRGVLALAIIGALIMVAGASAATVRVAITGSYTVAPVATDTTPTAVDVTLAGVAGDLIYAGTGTSTGTMTVNVSSFPFAGASGPGAGLTEFHGDASQGCVRIQGDRTIVVGHLPSNEQFDIPFGHMEWVSIHVKDNGVATGSPVDQGRASWSRTATGTNFCNPLTNPFPLIAPVAALSAGDVSLGYTDQLDGFPSNPDTDASIINPNGLSVTVTDAPDPDGINVVVGAGSGSAELSSCGSQVNVAADSTVVLTCASLVAEVVVGSAEVVLGGGLVVVSIPEGGKAEIADDGSGGFTVENLGPEPLTVTVDGIGGTIDPGETTTLEAWDFQGFFRRVADMPVKNVVNAGAAVPLVWRVLDSSGTPVTDLSSAVITVSDLDCETSEGSGAVEQTTTVGSKPQNLGDGYYQLNWKTAKSYAGTCKTLHLDIGDGVTHDAFFEFK